MSNEELVGAYVEGAISRRTLIRRLVAAGVSLGAATAYAHHLAPEAEARGAGPFEYPRVGLRILSADLGEALRDGKLEVRVRSSDPCRLLLTLSTRHNGAQVPIGERRVRFQAADTKKVKIDIARPGPLRGRRRARVRVAAVSFEGAYQPLVASTGKTLVR